MINPCELQVICDGLGIEPERLAHITNVDMIGQNLDGEDEAKVRAVQEHTDAIISAMVQTLTEIDDRTVRVYADDESMWRDNPDFAPYPAKWLRVIAYRVISQVDGVIVCSA